MLSKQEFLDRVEAFLVAADMSATRFGREAVKDPRFVSDLRAGRSVTLGVIERVVAFMAAWETEQESAS